MSYADTCLRTIMDAFMPRECLPIFVLRKRTGLSDRTVISFVNRREYRISFDEVKPGYYWKKADGVFDQIERVTPIIMAIKTGEMTVREIQEKTQLPSYLIYNILTIQPKSYFTRLKFNGVDFFSCNRNGLEIFERNCQDEIGQEV